MEEEVFVEVLCGGVLRRFFICCSHFFLFRFRFHFFFSCLLEGVRPFRLLPLYFFDEQHHQRPKMQPYQCVFPILFCSLGAIWGAGPCVVCASPIIPDVPLLRLNRGMHPHHPAYFNRVISRHPPARARRGFDNFV